MIAMLSRRFGRVIRYGFVGLIMALLYNGLTVAFYKGGLTNDPTWASVWASLLIIPVSFLSHRHTTYADVARHHAQIWRYAVIAVTTFVLNTGTMKLVDLNRWPFWIALIVTWFLVPASNYLINALWIFRVDGLLALKAERHDS